MKVRFPFLVLLGLAFSLGIAHVGIQPSVQAIAGFSPNQELPLPLLAPIGPAPVSFVVRGLEPSIRVDQQGTIYVSSIRGVPGGIDMHRWSPFLEGPANSDGTLPFKYLGQPDACGILSSGCQFLGISEGGGDTDIAVGFPPAGQIPNLAVTSQTLVPGETSFRSTDRGQTFTMPNPISNPIVGEDREWMDSIGPQTVYMAVHDAETFNINVFRSNDGGQTYLDGFGQAIDPQTFPAAGGVPASNTANVAGSFRVDRSQCSSSRGNLYSIFVAPDSAQENLTGQTFRSVYVATSTDVKLNLPVFTFTDQKIYTGPVGVSNENLFPAMAVDNFGNLYAVWSNNRSILYSYSTNQGASWSTPTAINQGSTLGMSNVFPWIDADANGHVGIVWFGSDRPGNSNDVSIHEPCTGDPNTCMTQWTNWNVFYAESVNAHAAVPFFTQTQISDHVMHRGTISTGGLVIVGPEANRNLADYFQIAFDPNHRANVAFSDDFKRNPSDTDATHGPDNPATRRLIRVNFTRQLITTPGIVGTSGCTVGPPEQGRRITGGGHLGSPVNFGFIAKETPLNGSLQYQDDDASLKVHSSNGIDSITFVGSCATFTGNAKVNQQLGYRFQITACDIAEPGTGKDTFTIDVTGPAGFSYHKAGTLTQGDVQVH